MQTNNAKKIICLLISIAYIVGIVLMFAKQMAAGIGLWSFSTLAGLIALWWIRRNESDEGEDKKP